jgi:hypothetical protein
LLGVGASEIDQVALFAALRHIDVDSCGAGALARELPAQRFFQFFAVFEVNGNVDVSRNVRLRQIQLLEQSGEKLSGIELLA